MASLQLDGNAIAAASAFGFRSRKVPVQVPGAVDLRDPRAHPAGAFAATRLPFGHGARSESPDRNGARRSDRTSRTSREQMTNNCKAVFRQWFFVYS